jgi:CRP/FNR family transcriptional regulator, cyclic AMP receptor protein
MGNNRANAISENEPNYEADCERYCEVQHNENLTPDLEDSFLAGTPTMRLKDYPSNM